MSYVTIVVTTDQLKLLQHVLSKADQSVLDELEQTDIELDTATPREEVAMLIGCIQDTLDNPPKRGDTVGFCL